MKRLILLGLLFFITKVGFSQKSEADTSIYMFTERVDSVIVSDGEITDYTKWLSDSTKKVFHHKITIYNHASLDISFMNFLVIDDYTSKSWDTLYYKPESREVIANKIFIYMKGWSSYKARIVMLNNPEYIIKVVIDPSIGSGLYIINNTTGVTVSKCVWVTLTDWRKLSRYSMRKYLINLDLIPKSEMGF